MKREIIAIVLFSVTIVFFSRIPYKLAEISMPSGMVFMGFIGPNQDPNSYLAWCKQAQEGKLLFEDKYTTEKQNRHFFHPYFLAVGRIAMLFGINIETAYEMSRLFLGFCLLLIIYIFSIVYFGTSGDAQIKRIFAFLFASIISGFGWVFPGSVVDKLENMFNLKPVDLWVTEGFTFLTILIRPLFSLTQILILLFFIFLYISRKNRKLIYSCLSGFCLFFIGLVHPYDLVTIYLAVAIYLFLQFRFYREDIRFTLVSSLLPIVFSLPVLLYEYLLFTGNSVFSKWSETITVSPNPLAYIIGYGILLIFAVIIIPFVYNRRRDIDMLILSWVFAVAILVYMPLNFQRRLIMGIQVPLALLTVEAIFHIIKLKSIRINKIVIFSVLLIISVPSNIRYVTYSIFHAKRYYLNYNISGGDFAALKWIDTNIPSEATILSSFTTGLYIPGRTGNKVYVGHWDQTIDLSRKLTMVRGYYSGNMDYKERIKFLKENGINYVYCGLFEKAICRLDLDKEKYLTLVYPVRKNTSNGDLVKLYKVE